MYYDVYSIANGQDKAATKALYGILFAYSDSFSLVYCKPSVTELFHIKPALIKWKLQKYLLQTKQASSWPGTWIGNGSRQVYYLETCQTDYRAFEIISHVSELWKWNAPAYPMDLCFYKDGVAWFELTVHEHLCKLYIGQEGRFPLKEDIDSLGILLEFIASVEFLNEKAAVSSACTVKSAILAMIIITKKQPALRMVHIVPLLT